MTPSLPTWVQKRDGRREAFDADKISQSIFAATEAVGAANAFLARELTDGVLHFLEQENGAETIPTQQIAELVEKVVRELGQPELAQRYARTLSTLPPCAGQDSAARKEVSFTFCVDEHPDDVRRNCLEAYSLNAVFGRDLAAAHRAELLTLSGLKTPRLLDAVVVDPPSQEQCPSPWSLAWSQVQCASRRAARLVIFDSPELLFAAHGPAWLEGIHAAHQAHMRQIVLNLRMPTRPAWAKDIATGPLFGNTPAAPGPVDSGTIALLDAAERNGTLSFLIDWHLQAGDFENDVDRQVHHWLLARPRLWRRTTFVFDRTSQCQRLGAGIDHSRPAILMRIGLDLTKFLQLPEIAGDSRKLVAKLPSLMRMAVSAGVQRRNYLRRHCPDLSRGFLLDRARLIINPCQIVEAVHRLVGAYPHQSRMALDVGRQILQVLADAAERESRTASLDIAVVYQRRVDLAAPETEMNTQLNTGGALMQTVQDGFLRLRTPPLSSAELWRHLRTAWRVPGISRLMFFPSDAAGPANTSAAHSPATI